MAAIIECSNCSKYFGTQKAVENVTLAVEEGEIFGLMGPNGSGKSSLIKMLVTLLAPSQGDIFIAGKSVWKDKKDIRRIVGYMPDEFGVYAAMKVKEYLDYFAACYQIGPEERIGTIHDLLELVDLTQQSDVFIEDLSKGMLQRLSFARMLVHDPHVLILDEPAAGWDLRGRIEIYNMLSEMGKLGKTIFIASQSVADLDQICSRTAFIEKGQITWSGELKQLEKQLFPNRKLKINIMDGIENTLKILEKIPIIQNIKVSAGENEAQKTLEMDFNGDETVQSQVLGYLTKFGIQVSQFNIEAIDPELLYLQLDQESIK